MILRETAISVTIAQCVSRFNLLGSDLRRRIARRLITASVLVKHVGVRNLRRRIISELIRIHIHGRVVIFAIFPEEIQALKDSPRAVHDVRDSSTTR